MQSVKKAFVAAAIFLSVASVSSYAADVAKIGIVDFQKILKTSSSGKAAQDEITRKGEEMEGTLKKKGEEIENLKKQLERDMLVLDRDKRDEKEREIRIKVSDFKDLQKRYMEDFKVFESKLIIRIQKDVLEIVEEIGKAEGYTLIVEKPGVLYAPQSADITEKVIKTYNDKFSQKK